MKIYKTSYTTPSGESAGYHFASSNRKAAAYSVPGTIRETEVIEVKPTKKGILEALNTHASHNDNG